MGRDWRRPDFLSRRRPATKISAARCTMIGFTPIKRTRSPTALGPINRMWRKDWMAKRASGAKAWQEQRKRREQEWSRETSEESGDCLAGGFEQLRKFRSL